MLMLQRGELHMAGDFSCARTRDQGSCGFNLQGEVNQAILSYLRLLYYAAPQPRLDIWTLWSVEALDNISMSFEGYQHHSSLP